MFLKMGYGVYFFFASLMILSIPFVYYLIPETKGVPLERMDELFGIKPVPSAHAVLVGRMKDEDCVRRESVGMKGDAGESV